MTENLQEFGWLAGGGEMGARMRAFDWARSPLGAPPSWPRSLKTVVRIMLTSRQPIWIGWGKDLIYLYNDPYKPIIGARHPWAFGQPARDVWPETWSQIGPMLAVAMAGDEGTYVEADLLIMERSGYPEETYYTYSYTPVPDDDGGNGGIICANTDDTKRVIGERQLALLRELATATADARTIQAACDRSAEALATNRWDLPYAMIYLSEPKEECLTLASLSGIDAGHPAAAGAVPLTAASSSWPLAKALAEDGPYVVDDPALRFGAEFPTGTWAKSPTHAALVPIPSAGEAPAGVVVAGLNPFRLFDDDYKRFLGLVAGQISAGIANAKALEDEQRRAKMLAELDRAKTIFFSDISHEFRTPLTLMIGPLEDALANAKDLGQENRERLALMHRNARRLLKLVNALLEFSRIEAGRVQAAYQPVDIAAETADLASVFRSAIELAGLKLVVDCPRMPEPVYVDLEMWEKIVLNLLSNAFKFTHQGRIGVTMATHGTSTRLSISDTGVGIPQAEIPRLFERFHRIEGQPGRTHEGTGIGLALVQELVHLHGGSVAVESAVGHGTTFTVTIPFGHAHLPADRICTPRSLAAPASRAGDFVDEALGWLPTGAGDPGRASMDVDDIAAAASQWPVSQRARVLLADDNADMRRYVSSLLSTRWDIRAVADGQAALDEARRDKPDLVLADVMMPRLDGLAMLAAFRQDPLLRDVPIILLSARAGEEARVEGLQAGADDYLVKPFAARELIARVESRLALARQRAEELVAMSRLQELSARLTATADLSSLLGDALDAIMELQRADFGTIQLYDPDANSLAICAQRGFSQEFLDDFLTIDIEARSASGMAARDRQRVIIDDVLTHPGFGSLQANAARAGFRAVHATPLVDGNSGSFLGIVTTHFREPHRPTERDLRLTDLYARQAADVFVFRLSEQRLRESEARLKAAIDLLVLGCYNVDTQDGTLVCDSRVKAMWGLPPDAAVNYRIWRDAIHPDDVAGVEAAIRRCREPEGDGVYDVEYRVIGITDGIERWIAARGCSTFQNGILVAFFGVALDVTTRKRTEQANQLLIGELQNRTRNLLAVVQAISQETRAASKSLDDFSVRFDGRLQALSRVQGLLSQAEVTPVMIGELVRLELEALAADLSGGRVHIEGPNVALPMRSVQILALALHELATNARKYGALAAPEGRLAVTWRTTKEASGKRLAVEWYEHRPVAEGSMSPPERRGFGRTLIEDALPYQLDAETQLEFTPDGVFCSIALMLET